MKKNLFKRIFSILLAVIIAVGTIPVATVSVSAATSATADGLEYSIENDEVTITGYTGSATELEIPAEIEGCPVVSIGDDAFYNCTDIVNMIIPEGVTTICEYAFYGCTSLNTVFLPASVTSIEKSAFDRCTSLKTVHYGGSSKMWENISILNYNETLLYAEKVFHIEPDIPEGLGYSIENGEVTITGYSGDAENLVIPAIIDDCPVTKIGLWSLHSREFVSVTIPEGVTTIEDGAFFHCLNLKSIIIPESVTIIGDVAFKSCESLESITIPESVVTIGEGAFGYCTSLSKVVIPYGTKNIGNNAFESCASLVSVTISKSVKSIGDYAFYGCDELKTVYYDGTAKRWERISIGLDNKPLEKAEIIVQAEIPVPEGLEYIIENDEAVITDYTGIATELIIPPEIDGYLVISIGDNAFYQCYSLVNAILPDTIVTIGNSAFCDCASLERINIPKSVIAIGDKAFSGCERLTSVILPDSVTSIGEGAFSRCFSLTSIILPEGVTDIRSSTFYDCENLTSVTIPEGVTSIGNNAFSYCENLTSIAIPEGVTSIGDNAFSYCESLTNITIPENVVSIGGYAFSGCTKLIDITMPESVSSIGQWAFVNTAYYNNSSNWKNDVLYLGNALLCANRSVRGNYKVRAGTTVIADASFSYCTMLTSISIPDSVTSIGKAVAIDCISLVSLEVDSNNAVYYSEGNCVIRREDGVLVMGCKNSVLPDSIAGIDDFVFLECSYLTEMTIPDNVTSIGIASFAGCYNLESITIPKAVTNIGDRAFAECTNLSVAYYGGTIDDWKAISIGSGNNKLIGALIVSSDDTSLPLAFEYNIENGEVTITGYTGNSRFLIIPGTIEGYPVTTIGAWSLINKGISAVTIPESVTTIGDGAFYINPELESITIPESVTTIGGCAFSLCSSLETINIPEGVTSLGANVFDGCSSLVSITVPSSITSIGNDAFIGCSSLEDVHITDIEAWCNISFGNSTAHPMYYANNLYLNGDSVVELVIPDGVTTIPQYSFYGCTSIVRVSIPRSVTKIDTHAFTGCSGLEIVYYEGTEEEWDEVTIVSSRDHTGNAEIIYAEVLFLGEPEIPEEPEEPPVLEGLGYVIENGQAKITYYNGSDTEIEIPVDIGGYPVTVIGSSAFWDCTKLLSVTLPEGITTIEENAFGYCTSLESVNIPDGVTYIGPDAFYYCASLAEINIPAGISTICERVFGYCESLEAVTIPDNITGISGCAFEECWNITSITIPESVSYIGTNAFSGCYNIATVFYDGTAMGWDAVDIKSGNYMLETVSIVFLKEPGAEPIPRGLEYVIKNGEIMITDYTGDAISVKIPESIGGYSVTRINRNAFTSCKKLSSVIIPDSVRCIDVSAFENCESLVSVQFGSGLVEICDYAFAGCSSLASLEIPEGVTYIWMYAFSECASLESVYLPQSLEIMEYKAFYRCSSVASVTYNGSPSDFEDMYIGNGNEDILYADISFLMEDEPSYVFIPVPEGMRAEDCILYYVDGYGVATPVQVECIDGYFVAMVQKVGYYILRKSEEEVPVEPDIPDVDATLADLNGDGDINAKDANIMKQIIAGSVSVEAGSNLLLCSDLNGDGELNAKDSNLLKRIIAGALQL